MCRWREQYDRMKRWESRLYYDAVMHGEHAADSFYAFAQTCYHLVDWLENDQTQPVRRERAKAYVNASPLLTYCAGICNGSKHAQLEAKKVQVTSRKTAQSVPFEDDSGEPHEITSERTELFVGWQGTVVDIETFAASCVDAWDQFLRTEGLLK